MTPNLMKHLVIFSSVLLVVSGNPSAGQDSPPTDGLDRQASERFAHAKRREAYEVERRDMHVERHYAASELTPAHLEEPIPDFIGTAWEIWSLEVRKVLREVGLIEHRLWRSGGRTLERSAEFDLVEHEWHAYAERYGEDGDDFINVAVWTAVCYSSSFEDIDRVYYVIRRLLERPAMSKLGPFEDVNESVGDACHHFGKDSFGFCRGNVIVEIHARRYTRQNGRIQPLGVDADLRKKVMQAARRIDQLLLEKMFDEETRAKIMTAEKTRRAQETGQQ